jgi:hypothetical protein
VKLLDDTYAALAALVLYCTSARDARIAEREGQEAPVVILSLCRSAGESETGGRGLDFVLDANRLNVGLSRAQSLAIVVADPRLALSKGTSTATIKRLNLFARLSNRPTPYPESSLNFSE